MRTKPGSEIDIQCMELFEQSVGQNVRVKGTPLVDEITGVNWDLMTVKVKNYGEFGVHLCELTNEENSAPTN
jgi:hypothetical protein